MTASRETTPSPPSSNTPRLASFSKPHKEPQPHEIITRVILDIAQRQGTVNADDARAALPHAPHKRSLFGSAFQHLVQTQQLIPTGYTQSTHPTNNGRTIRTYRPRHTNSCP